MRAERERGPVAMTETRTITSSLQWASALLSEHGIDDAKRNAELFLSHVLGSNRTRLYIDAHSGLDDRQAREFQSMILRRISREPLQYIIGETEFMGLTFHVDKSVLIPRPETEILVERVLQAIGAMSSEAITVLDIGTGSGNIATALACLCPRVEVTAMDNSAEALGMASRNVIRHAARNVMLVEADVFSEFLPGLQFDVIVSNPPYVSAGDFEGLQPEIRLFEPRNATTDGGDGFLFLRRILRVAPRKLRSGGAIFVELGYSQSDEAKKVAVECGLVDVTVHDDLAGIPRVLEGWMRSEPKRDER